MFAITFVVLLTVTLIESTTLIRVPVFARNNVNVDHLTDLTMKLNENVNTLIDTLRDNSLEAKQRDLDTQNLILEVLSGKEQEKRTHTEGLRNIDRIIAMLVDIRKVLKETVCKENGSTSFASPPLPSPFIPFPSSGSSNEIMTAVSSPAVIAGNTLTTSLPLFPPTTTTLTVKEDVRDETTTPFLQVRDSASLVKSTESSAEVTTEQIVSSSAEISSSSSTRFPEESERDRRGATTPSLTTSSSMISTESLRRKHRSADNTRDGPPAGSFAERLAFQMRRATQERSTTTPALIAVQKNKGFVKHTSMTSRVIT